MKASDFKDIFHKYNSKVYSYFCYYIHDLDMAKDLTQETFINLYNAIFTKGSKIDNVEAYIFFICKNKVVDHYRKLAGEKKFKAQYIEHYLRNQNNSIDANLEERILDNYEELENLVSNLPPQQQRILKLNKIDGLTYKQIAKKLDISPHTVRNNLQKAMKNLKMLYAKNLRSS